MPSLLTANSHNRVRKQADREPEKKHVKVHGGGPADLGLSHRRRSLSRMTSQSPGTFDHQCSEIGGQSK